MTTNWKVNIKVTDPETGKTFLTMVREFAYTSNEAAVLALQGWGDMIVEVKSILAGN